MTKPIIEHEPINFKLETNKNGDLTVKASTRIRCLCPECRSPLVLKYPGWFQELWKCMKCDDIYVYTPKQPTDTKGVT